MSRSLYLIISFPQELSGQTFHNIPQSGMLAELSLITCHLHYKGNNAEWVRPASALSRGFHLYQDTSGFIYRHDYTHN